MYKTGDHRLYFPVLVLCVFILVFYQFLIYSSPVIYWDDAHIRWALRDQLLLGRWLPAIQAFVFLSSKITSSLYFLKTLMSLLAIGSLVAAYTLARRLFSPWTGLIVVLFLAFNMMFAALAIVPYSEVLFVGLAFMAFNLLDEPPFTRRFYLGLAMLNLASLTSYTGWLLAAICIIAMALRLLHAMDWRPALWQTLKITLLCSLAPIVWLIFGVSESGNLLDRLWSIFRFVAAPTAPSLSEHILSRLNPAHIQEFSSQYFHLLTWQAGMDFLILGAIGFLLAASDAPHRRIHLGIISFLVLDWCVLALLQPWKLGSLRQPFLLQTFILLYAAYGLTQGISWLAQRYPLNSGNWKKWISVLAVVILSARLIPSTTRFVTGNSRDSGLLTLFEIGNWFNAQLKEDDAILVLDDTDYYPYALATYMEYPLERILDDRLETHVIMENLEKAQKVYIIELYASQDGLSTAESRVLEDLKSGRVHSERFVFGAVNVWYAPAGEIVYSP